MSGIAMSGHVIARDESGSFLSGVDAGVTAAVSQAVDDGESLAKIAAPKGRTLELVNSIMGLLLSSTQGQIVAMAPHAIFQEEGAGPHEIGVNFTEEDFHVLANPDEGFGPVLAPVLHPGNPALHFLRTSGDVVAGLFGEYLAEHLP